jgi:hypothetical protein
MYTVYIRNFGIEITESTIIYGAYIYGSYIYGAYIYIYIYGACIYTVLANRSHTQKRKSRCCACACVSCMDVYVPQIAPKNEYLLQGCALRLVCWEKTACCVGKRLPEGVPVGALRLVRREKTVCWENTARCVGKRLPAAGVCATSCVLGKDCLLGIDCLL